MTTGPSDLLCRVVARDNDHLGQVISRILEIPGIARTTTSLILATRIAPRQPARAARRDGDDRVLDPSTTRRSDQADVTVELAGDHPGRDRPGVPGPARRPGRPGRRLGAGRADPRAGLQRRGTRGVAPGRATPWTSCTSEYACAGLPGGQGRYPAPGRPGAAAGRGDASGWSRWRVPLPAGRRAGPAAGVLRVVRRRGVLVDPVPAPSVCAAVHARAGRDPRGDRPRQPAGRRRATPTCTDWWARRSARTQDEEALRFLSHVFWYTMEFGVVREGGELRAYGAGILSSVGETSTFRDAEVRPVDFLAMGRSTTTSPGSSRCCTCGRRRRRWRIGSAGSSSRSTIGRRPP